MYLDGGFIGSPIGTCLTGDDKIKKVEQGKGSGHSSIQKQSNESIL
jgi:hypothetical protein